MPLRRNARNRCVSDKDDVVQPANQPEGKVKILLKIKWQQLSSKPSGTAGDQVSLFSGAI
jgi:hypothetical protein